MKLNDIITMADDQIECDFGEVKMYTLIEIAKSLKNIENTLETVGEHFVGKEIFPVVQ